MNLVAPGVVSTPEDEKALADFRRDNPDLFKKDDRKLYMHLSVVIGLLIAGTLTAILVPSIPVKILAGIFNGFLWFSLINVTIHHHNTHRNAAASETAKKILDIIYLISLPNAPRRRSRYTRAHLNHHLRPFHETDLDHHYATAYYLRMMKTAWTKFIYYLELTFVGAHMPGWEDDKYMNEVPMEKWSREEYEKVKAVERKKAVTTALWQWAGFFLVLKFVPFIAWGWIFPMLLVKNWAHFLGQFQHYDERFLNPETTIWKRTKTYHVPAWLNYLAGGEISGHFIHHLFPEMPYYLVETARQRFTSNPAYQEFAIY